MATDDFAVYETSLLGSWRLLATAAGDAAVRDDGTAVTMTHPHPALCNAILRSPAGLDRIREEFGPRHHAIWTPSTMPELLRTMEAVGYVRDVRTVPMLLDLERWSPEPSDVPVVSEPPGDLAERSGIGRAYLADVPDTFAHATAGRESWAITMTTGDDVNVSFVTTLEEHQRRGFARAVMTRALLEARERGARRAALQSTEEGLRLYRGLGFREAGAWQEWLPAAVGSPVEAAALP